MSAKATYTQIHAELSELTDGEMAGLQTENFTPAPAPAAKPAAIPFPADGTPAEQIAWYQAENARLKAAKSVGGKLTLKVSEKGAMSVYGVGRFPVTLYRAQWERLLADEQVKVMKSFLAANAASLSEK